MIMINTLIGAIAICLILCIMYCIGRIIIRCMNPETLHPDIENMWTATAIGGTFLCILGIVVVVCSTLGEVVVRVLQ